MEVKRKADDFGAMVPAKKTRQDVSIIGTREKAVVTSAVPRTSGLLAPIMQLEGHQGEVFSARFHPEGRHLASAGFDRQIFLWNVYGMCENVMVMKGHAGAVMEINFSADGAHLYSAGTDRAVAVWDVPTGQRLRRLRGHDGFVNSVAGVRRGPEALVSAGDDSTARVWDPRQRAAAAVLTAAAPLTAALLDDGGARVLAAGVDDTVAVWDVRAARLEMRLRGHADTVTGLALSHDGSYLASTGADGALRVWDVRPFAPAERCVKLLTGFAPAADRTLLRVAWAPDGTKVAAGSADRLVHVWDTTSRRSLYRLPGHRGAVTDVQFHPREPILLSASSDKTLYLGEIDN